MSPIYGKRLIVSLIDQCAADEPEKLYASVPRNEEDLSQGFKDITYAQLANAINHASWWLDSALGKSNGSFEPFAYVGPKDLMYPILAVAAAKVGRRNVDNAALAFCDKGSSAARAGHDKMSSLSAFTINDQINRKPARGTKAYKPNDSARVAPMDER
ncbi:hypothetical protein MMC31_006195 [Peltigera leucophlebia]|nr:hypothetical protein [Peltigera leucophlebia]